MRKRVNTYVLLCAVGMMFLGSCTKETIELPQPNDPVFTLNGTLGGVEFDLVAGDDNAYMHTNTVTVNGVNLFTGELSDGNFSLELGIFDGMIDKPGHVTVDEIQNIVPTFSRRSNEPLVVLSMSMLGNSQNISNVDWYLNNSFAGSNEVPITKPGKYYVCAFITFANNETEQLCDEIIVGYQRNANYSIHYDMQPGSTAFTADINGAAGSPAVENVEWYVNDSLVSTNIYLQYSLTSLQTFRLKSRVYFAGGIVRTRTVLIDGINGVNSVDDFSVFEMTSVFNGPNQDFNIRLKILSEGKTYLSEYANNENSSLIITGVEYYGKNDNNNDVYKVSGIVDAVVMEVVTEKKVPVSFATVFGVEIQ